MSHSNLPDNTPASYARKNNFVMNAFAVALFVLLSLAGALFLGPNFDEERFP